MSRRETEVGYGVVEVIRVLSFFVVFVLGVIPVRAQDIRINDIVFGEISSPVTVVEYTSPICPYCLKFKNESWSRIKRDLIDTGKVRWVIRPFPIGSSDYVLYALMRCDGEKKLEFFEEASRDHRNMMRLESDPASGVDSLKFITKMSRSKIIECLNNKNYVADVQSERDFADREGVKVTPTFFVNGKKIQGYMKTDDFLSLF